MTESKITRDYILAASAEFARLQTATAPQSNGGLGFTIESFSTSLLQLGLDRDGYLNKFYRIWINGVNHVISSTDPLVPTAFALDLSTTGLNGIVDGISFEMGRQYLFWAIANDANTAFTGVVATRKPSEEFVNLSAVIGGSPDALKGTSTYFTINTGRSWMFTLGARIRVVTDNNPTNGVGEWNWGVITEIDGGGGAGTITILMDNNSEYGFDITGSGTIAPFVSELQQQDSFQPWVVGVSSQDLYAPNFRLLGELYTDAGSGDITEAYKADDEFRKIDVNPDFSQIWGVTATAAATVSSARYIPLWANQASFTLYGNSANPGDVLTLADTSAEAIIYMDAPGGTTEQFVLGTGFIPLEKYCNLYVDSTDTGGSQNIYLTGYRVQGGMRL